MGSKAETQANIRWGAAGRRSTDQASFELFPVGGARRDVRLLASAFPTRDASPYIDGAARMSRNGDRPCDALAAGTPCGDRMIFPDTGGGAGDLGGARPIFIQHDASRRVGAKARPLPPPAI